MRRRSLLLLGVAVLASAGCSLQQTRTVNVPGPTVTESVIVHRQALDWTVTSSYFAASDVRLSYPLCPGQTLDGPPQVQQGAENVSITMWATQATCSNPATENVVIHLGKPLGHRALTNPSLLQ